MIRRHEPGVAGRALALEQRVGRPAHAARLLDPWPVDRPRNWVQRLNQPESEAELAAVRQSLNRGAPFGDEAWRVRTATRLGLEASLNPRGRPRKAAEK